MKVRKFHRDDRPNAPRGATWFVDGKRKAKFFETQDERDEHADKLKGAVRASGESYLRIDPARHMAWLRADELLGGADQVTAAQFYLKHHRPLTDTKLEDAKAAFIKERSGRGYNSMYVAHLRRHVEEFDAALR